MPARQHLEADQLAGRDVDLLFVIGDEFALADPFADTRASSSPR